MASVATKLTAYLVTAIAAGAIHASIHRTVRNRVSDCVRIQRIGPIIATQLFHSRRCSGQFSTSSIVTTLDLSI